MAFTCDPTTRAELNAAPNKQAWGTVLNAALGNTRRIRCKRDANADAADPWTTGTEFRNVGSTGSLKFVGGKVVGFGRLKGNTIQLAADVSTGKSVLRVEGNGRWFQVTLGVAGSGADVIANGLFTATNGLALKPDFAISGGRFLPSGVGAAAPALTASSPKTLEFFNWTNPASPVSLGVIEFNTRIDDWVYEDAEMGAENGDMALYQSTQSVMYGYHEFGATLGVSAASNTESGAAPLYEVAIAQAVRGEWTTYPTVDTFPGSAITTHPDPWKAVLKDGNGNVLHTFEMSDGLPINSPDLFQGRSSTQALRPSVNTAIMPYWRSSRPKISAKKDKFVPGPIDVDIRPTMAHNYLTVIGVPTIMGNMYRGNSKNALNNLWSTPQWPKPEAPYSPYNGIQDPYNAPYNGTLDSAKFNPWVCGWDYEPGSISHHDWLTGPGGPRQDRCILPSVLALFCARPTGKRPFEDTAWSDIAEGYAKANWNRSNKWVRNVKTMELAPSSEFINKEWHTSGNFYGGYNAVNNKTIYYAGVAAAQTRNDTHNDAKGLLYWNGWLPDWEHHYASAAWGALIWNSPMFAIANTFDFREQLMFEQSDVSSYMLRTQAWNWMHHVMAWKLAATHALGFSRADIEDRFVRNLEAIHDQIYVPTFVTNSQEPKFVALRNLGAWNADTGESPAGGGQTFYMGHVLVLMKQFGMWDAIKKRGGKAWLALQMQMRNMDELCFGYISESRASEGPYPKWSAANIPANWPAYDASKPPGDGDLSDWYYDAAGAFREGDVTKHAYRQYAYLRRDYFPEIPHAKLAATINKFEMYDERMNQRIADWIATRSDYLYSIDYTYRYAGLAAMKAPSELGPA